MVITKQLAKEPIIEAVPNMDAEDFVASFIRVFYYHNQHQLYSGTSATHSKSA